MSQARDEFLRDIAMTAVESGLDGIGYWASCKRYKWSSANPVSLDHMLKFPEIHITPAEDPNDFEDCQILVSNIKRGVRAIADGEIQVRKDLKEAIILADKQNDASYIDAECADVIVQVGLFNEIRFG